MEERILKPLIDEHLVRKLDKFEREISRTGNRKQRREAERAQRRADRKANKQAA